MIGTFWPYSADPQVVLVKVENLLALAQQALANHCQPIALGRSLGPYLGLSCFDHRRLLEIPVIPRLLQIGASRLLQPRPMVVHSRQNGQCPVELLVEHQAGELMRQGQRTKGQTVPGRRHELGGQTDVRAQQKSDRVRPFTTQPAEPVGQLPRRAADAAPIDRYRYLSPMPTR